MTPENLPISPGCEMRNGRSEIIRKRLALLRWFCLGYFFILSLLFSDALVNIAKSQPTVPAVSESSFPLQLNVRFQNGLEIFSPQGTVLLEVQPVWLQSEALISTDRSLNLHVSVYQNPVSENTTDHSGGRTSFVSAIPGKKQESEKKNLLYEQELSVSVHPGNPAIPVTFLAPAKEGVYQIVLTLQQKKETPSQSLWLLSSNPLQRSPNKILAETSCQCVVVRPQSLSQISGEGNDYGEKEFLETLDTNGPNRSKRWTSIPSLPKVANLSAPKFSEITKLYHFRERPSNSATSESNVADLSEEKIETNLANLPVCVTEFLEQYHAQPAGPFGSGHYKQRTNEPKENQDSEVIFSVLEPASERGESWEAFSFTSREAEKKHLLEIEYPADQVQSLGVLIIDLIPDKNGKMLPVIASNCGFYVPENTISLPRTKRTGVHRIPFWPKSKHSILILSNRRRDKEASIGKVSLYQISNKKHSEVSAESQNGVQRISSPLNGEAGRTVAGYLHTTTFFSEQSSPLNPVVLSRDFVGESAYPSDWQASYDGGTRLIERIRQNGFDGLMLNVASQNLVLYPSFTLHYASERRLTNSPERPAAKDTLELMLRLFDREKLSFIPTIDFNMLLPVIENRLYHQAESANQLLYVDLNGNPIETPKAGGMKSGSKGERYNLLHPDVQEAMIDVAVELAGRCASHSSFSGIGVVLSPQGYAQLPNPLYGLDDRTIEQFQLETGTELPDTATAFKENTSPQRFADRAHYFQTHPTVSEAWISWRCQKVREFYHRMHTAVQAVRPDAKLFLAGGTMLDHPEIQFFCRPSLFSGPQLPNALRMIGFDFTKWDRKNSLIFLRPERISTTSSSENLQCYQDFNSPELRRFWEQIGLENFPLLFHDADDRFAMFPVGESSRRRFVKQLAQRDLFLLFDGGSSLPVAEDEALHDFLTAFRKLPSVAFQTYSQTENKLNEKSGPEDEPSIQPIILRYLETPEGLTLYLINEAPFENKIEIRFRAAPETVLVELSGRRQIPQAIREGSSLCWQFEMQPYDFIALKSDGGKISLDNIKVERPQPICGPNGLLKQKVELLGDQIRKAQRGVAWDKLQNPDCEPLGPENAALHGWENLGGTDFQVRLDSIVKNSGRSSLRLSKDSSADIGALYSNAFEAPTTGRLFVSFFIGLPKNASMPSLDVVLAGRFQGNTLMRSYRATPILKTSRPEDNLTGEVFWQNIVVPFDHLPTKDLEDLRLGFILTQSATLWIDDIKLYQVAFTKDEMNILYRLVSVADRRCSNERVSDLLTILDGYWVRFLFQHVPSDLPDRQLVSSTTLTGGTESDRKKPILSQSAKPLAKTAEKAPAKKPEAKPATGPSTTENSGFFDRFKKWLNP